MQNATLYSRSNSKHLSGMPALVTEFDGIPLPCRKRAEKGFEPSDMAMPIGWQLKQNRAELSAQSLGCFQQPGQRRLGIQQFFDMGQEAACLDGKTKSGLAWLGSSVSKVVVEGRR